MNKKNKIIESPPSFEAPPLGKNVSSDLYIRNQIKQSKYNDSIKKFEDNLKYISEFTNDIDTFFGSLNIYSEEPNAVTELVYRPIDFNVIRNKYKDMDDVFLGEKHYIRSKNTLISQYWDFLGKVKEDAFGISLKIRFIDDEENVILEAKGQKIDEFGILRFKADNKDEDTYLNLKKDDKFRVELIVEEPQSALITFEYIKMKICGFESNTDFIGDELDAYYTSEEIDEMFDIMLSKINDNRDNILKIFGIIGKIEIDNINQNTILEYQEYDISQNTSDIRQLQSLIDADLIKTWMTEDGINRVDFDLEKTLPNFGAFESEVFQQNNDNEEDNFIELKPGMFFNKDTKIEFFINFSMVFENFTINKHKKYILTMEIEENGDIDNKKIFTEIEEYFDNFEIGHYKSFIKNWYYTTDKNIEQLKIRFKIRQDTNDIGHTDVFLYKYSNLIAKTTSISSVLTMNSSNIIDDSGLSNNGINLKLNKILEKEEILELVAEEFWPVGTILPRETMPTRPLGSVWQQIPYTNGDALILGIDGRQSGSIPYTEITGTFTGVPVPPHSHIWLRDMSYNKVNAGGNARSFRDMYTFGLVGEDSQITTPEGSNSGEGGPGARGTSLAGGFTPEGTININSIGVGTDNIAAGTGLGVGINLYKRIS